MPDTSHKYLWILMGTGIIIFFAHLDVLYVNIMEARNFVTAREMLMDDNWILTTMNAQPRYEKPPLPTWLTAISGMLFGLDSLAAMRLPAALASLLLLFFFFRFIPKLQLSQKQSFLASLILATSFYIIFMGRNGQWDIFTHSFMLVSIYYLWNLFQQKEKLFQNAILAGLFFGFSSLSKGPVSLYALLLPFLIAYGSIYHFNNLRKKWKAFLMFLFLSLLVGGWWFLYVRFADPVAFIQTTTREATRWANYNVRPFYYYWSFFTQSGIWTIPAFVALLYPYLKNKVSNKKAYKFSIIWTFSAVILLSVIPEKKSRYLLPVLIPMALNTSFYIEYLFRRYAELPPKEKWIPLFNHTLIAVIGLAFPVVALFFLDLQGFWFWYSATSIFLFGLGVAILYYLKKQKYPVIFYLTVAFICGIIALGFPLSNAFLENPQFRNISEVKEMSKRQNLPVYEYNAGAPELVWEYGEPIPKIGEEEDLPKENIFGLLIRQKDSSFLKSLQPEYRILSSARYDLNYVHPEASGYKERLVRDFYILKKQD